jgi:acetoin utilization deacetylase AcuC-like enzyme
MVTVSSPLIVFAAPELDGHVTPPGHPEHQGRLDAALAGIGAAGLDEVTEWRTPRLASHGDLGLAHDPDYVDAVEHFCAAGGGQLDPDTSAVAGSWDTARRSAGAVLDAIDALRSGECDVAFAGGRPPGHHAVPDRAMGFCLFNNVAVGAAALAAAGQKVAIVDWDVHHGNGTQDIFYDDPNVLYVSTHQSPLYPGTGRVAETGTGAGERTTLNIPLPPGSAGDTFRAAFDTIVAPTVESFAPDWLIISAGYDGHRDDPLGSLGLTAGDYADLALRLQALVPARRLLVALEGGYDLGALRNGVGATLSALIGQVFRPEAASSGGLAEARLAEVRATWDL